LFPLQTLAKIAARLHKPEVAAPPLLPEDIVGF
jgi:hypothetical protein